MMRADRVVTGGGDSIINIINKKKDKKGEFGSYITDLTITDKTFTCNILCSGFNISRNI